MSHRKKLNCFWKLEGRYWTITGRKNEKTGGLRRVSLENTSFEAKPRWMLSPPQQYSTTRLFTLLYLWRNWLPFSKENTFFFSFKMIMSLLTPLVPFPRESAKGDACPERNLDASVKIFNIRPCTQGLSSLLFFSSEAMGSCSRCSAV